MKDINQLSFTFVADMAKRPRKEKPAKQDDTPFIPYWQKPIPSTPDGMVDWDKFFETCVDQTGDPYGNTGVLPIHTKISAVPH